MNSFDIVYGATAVDRNARQRIYGVVVGIVTDNHDPDKLCRVKVRFPWLTDGDASHWARIAAPMAGNDRGFYVLPEVEDEVLVMFEHGMIEYPYIIGALWNGKDKPPEENTDGKNNRRVLKSRSGHTIMLDDTDGEEKLIIRDKTGKNEIVMDAKDGSLTISSGKGVTLKSADGPSLSSNSSDIAIKCKNFTIEVEESFEIKSMKKGAIKAETGLTVDCMAGVNVNSGALEVK